MMETKRGGGAARGGGNEQVEALTPAALPVAG